jgi:hypothetical protein
MFAATGVKLPPGCGVSAWCHPSASHPIQLTLRKSQSWCPTQSAAYALHGLMQAIEQPVGYLMLLAWA